MVKKKDVTKDDISNTTVLIVLSVVVILSVFSVGYYLSVMQKTQLMKENSLDDGTGEVSLHLSKAPVRQELQETGGQVALNIAGPETINSLEEEESIQ